jgi:hypothetical protein
MPGRKGHWHTYGSAGWGCRIWPLSIKWRRCAGRVRRSPRWDYRTNSKAPRTMASNPVGVDGGSAAAGSLSIATTTKVRPLLLVAI